MTSAVSANATVHEICIDMDKMLVSGMHQLPDYCIFVCFYYLDKMLLSDKNNAKITCLDDNEGEMMNALFFVSTKQKK